MTICLYVRDPDWIVSLTASGARDDVNFWRKDARKLTLLPGDKFYFKIRKSSVIAGRGFFREQKSMSITDAWKKFGTRNGVATELDLRERAKAVLGLAGDTLNCLILDGVQFLSEVKRPEILPADFPGPVMAQKFFSDGDLSYITTAFADLPIYSPLDCGQIAAEAQDEFKPENISSSRTATLRNISVRRGQPKFRRCLLEAYQSSCSVTLEQAEEVLEAAHIHPYRGNDTNVVQNGILLRSDWHTLFDLGLWTIEDDYRIRISSKVKSLGYSDHEGKLLCLPLKKRHYPSKTAIGFHRINVFQP